MKKIIQIASFLTLGFVLIALNACSPKRVTRVEPEKVIDLSGRWNETDARLCAESLISQAIGGDWLGNFSNQEKRKPVVVVGLVRNNSHEHIETEIFIKDVEKAFLKSTLISASWRKKKRTSWRKSRPTKLFLSRKYEEIWKRTWC